MPKRNAAVKRALEEVWRCQEYTRLWLQPQDYTSTACDLTLRLFYGCFPPCAPLTCMPGPNHASHIMSVVPASWLCVCVLIPAKQDGDSTHGHSLIQPLAALDIIGVESPVSLPDKTTSSQASAHDSWHRDGGLETPFFFFEKCVSFKTPW